MPNQQQQKNRIKLLKCMKRNEWSSYISHRFSTRCVHHSTAGFWMPFSIFHSNIYLSVSFFASQSLAFSLRSQRMTLKMKRIAYKNEHIASNWMELCVRSFFVHSLGYRWTQSIDQIGKIIRKNPNFFNAWSVWISWAASTVKWPFDLHFITHQKCRFDEQLLNFVTTYQVEGMRQAVHGDDDNQSGMRPNEGAKKNYFRISPLHGMIKTHWNI